MLAALNHAKVLNTFKCASHNRLDHCQLNNGDTNVGIHTNLLL